MQKSHKVRFSFEKRAGKRAVFSLPQTNDYQEIKELSVEPKGTKLDFDEWGNTEATFTDTAIIEFLYSPKSIEKSLERNWVIQDYKKNRQIDFFLKPNRFINGKDEKIKKLAKSLIKNDQNVSKIAKTFYDFVLGYLTYGKPTEGLYPYSQALEEKVTDCGGFSTLLLSLFQSVRIPGRLVVGFVTTNNPSRIEDFFMHAWLEILLPDNSWFPMDASLEWRRNHNQSKRMGGFGKISADRLVTSFGQDFANGIELLQLPVYL